MEDLHSRFLSLHRAHQRSLSGFRVAAVRDPATAEGLLQEITRVLWKKFGEFLEGDPLEILDQVTPVLEQVWPHHPFRTRGATRIAPALSARG